MIGTIVGGACVFNMLLMNYTHLLIDEPNIGYVMCKKYEPIITKQR